MTAEPGRFTFLQVSDVHLDSKALAVGAPLTVAQRRMREQEMLDAFLRALETAREQKVDVVLIPGDLWENETVRGDTIARVIEACGALGEIPILITPGNKDYYSVDSPYNTKALQVRGLPTWPQNVFIFTSDQFVTIRHPLRNDVSFTGRAFTSDQVQPTRILKNTLPRREEATINILVLHGALEGYSGADADWPGKMTAPFSAAELKAQNFTYAALGHYHEFTEVKLDTGLLLGAYSGCLGGRIFDEIGPRCALLGTIEPGRPGRWNVSLEPMEFDTRRLIMVGADISGLSIEDMMDEISLSIEDQGGRPECDIVYLHLEGRYSPATEPETVIERLRERYSQLVVWDNTRPDYLGEKYDQRTTEWKFIGALLELKQKIERARAGTEPDTSNGSKLSGPIVEDALYYGLDALRQKRITVRNVD
ncbi:MAG TPA: DNA repair exonuclease [Trichormus sp.]|jgi:DNA repair exonuclease SbcCD nuclease subunit